MATEADRVVAAGCVLWRRRAPGGGPGDDPDGGPGAGSGTGSGIEIAVIHRPEYDDWSHPKGKLHPGETPREAALREVREETGMTCVLGAPLRTAHYEARGRPKSVHYWAAEATGGHFLPNGEVDRILWLPPPQARARLTRADDRPLLDEALATIEGAA